MTVLNKYFYQYKFNLMLPIYLIKRITFMQKTEMPFINRKLILKYNIILSIQHIYYLSKIQDDGRFKFL